MQFIAFKIQAVQNPGYQTGSTKNKIPKHEKIKKDPDKSRNNYFGHSIMRAKIFRENIDPGDIQYQACT